VYSASAFTGLRTVSPTRTTPGVEIPPASGISSRFCRFNALPIITSPTGDWFCDPARMSGDSDQPSVFRAGGISYLRIPAPDASRASAFYRSVFGWNVRGDAAEPSFDDATGHVIGHFMPDLPVAGEAGIRPYIYVESLDATLEAVIAKGGQVDGPPYPEGDLWVATFRDPSGNVLGVWQRAPRA